MRTSTDARDGLPTLSGRRVLVVDDDCLTRNGLRALLEREGAEVAAVASGEEALHRIRFFPAEVVIIDARLPGLSSVETTRRMARLAPDASVLTFASTADPAGVLDAVLAGSSGFLLRDAGFEEIVAFVGALAGGHVAIDTRVAGVLVAEVRKAPGPADVDREPARAPLSDRERDVLELLAGGLPNAQIGRHLHMSPSAVTKHVSRVLEKLGLANRVQAAAWAIRHGVVAGHDRLAA